MTKPYTCTECGKPCDAEWEDFGIGPYEFWGQKCNQVDYQWVSDCCGADTVEPPPDNDDRGDWEYEQQKDRELNP